jgi:hypothetical protein
MRAQMLNNTLVPAQQTGVVKVKQAYGFGYNMV